MQLNCPAVNALQTHYTKTKTKICLSKTKTKIKTLMSKTKTETQDLQDSSPVCQHQQTTVAKYPFRRSRGSRQTEDFLAKDGVPRPRSRSRPRARLWGSKTKTKTPRFKTKTETKTCKNRSRDVSRPRLKSRELQVCSDHCNYTLLTYWQSTATATINIATSNNFHTVFIAWLRLNTEE